VDARGEFAFSQLGKLGLGRVLPAYLRDQNKVRTSQSSTSKKFKICRYGRGFRQVAIPRGNWQTVHRG
jgi:hypothetical protein